MSRGRAYNESPVESTSGLRVVSVYSKAGIATAIHVRGQRKQDDFLFDCGIFEESYLSARHVFMSHGHTDHIGGCLSHARAKTLGSGHATYYIPEECYEALLEAKKAFERLDNAEITMKIVPLAPGATIDISGGYTVTTFRTAHRVPSLGYCVTHTGRGHLLPQYAHCGPQELARLHREHINTNSICQSIDLVYTGDTSMQGLLDANLPHIFTAEILLMEMTFLDGDLSKARRTEHIHLSDFTSHFHRFRNKHIVLLHLSARYGPIPHALGLLRNALVPQLACREQEEFVQMFVALRSFGSREELIQL